MLHLPERASACNSSLRPNFAYGDLRGTSKGARVLIARFGLTPATAETIAQLAGLGDGR
jgi:hypothetical protein